MVLGLPLRTLLEDLLGPDVLADAVPVTNQTHGLFDAEHAQVARAVPKRRNEWAAGRRLARRLLSELEIAPAPLLAGRDRAPRWPDGIVGSIAHTRDLCTVAVARAGKVRALGIDVENPAALQATLWPSILTPSEQAWLRRQPEAEQERWAMVIFSAKEALYKAQYGITQTMVDFREADITLFPHERRFEARIRHPCSALLQEPLAGRFAVGTWIFSGVRIERSG